MSTCEITFYCQLQPSLFMAAEDNSAERKKNNLGIVNGCICLSFPNYIESYLYQNV